MTVSRLLVRLWQRRGGTWWWTTLFIVIPVAGITAVTGLLLWKIAGLTDAATRLEAARTALTVGAGTGGIIALILASRRQWSTEQAHQTSEHDASERRITELYTKAVDQLGSSNASVRLGGLYALERLGNADQSQQVTIGNVICAYLRMPYSPHNERFPDEVSVPQQEIEVRQSAIDILCEHTESRSSDTHWPRLRINLQRAELGFIDLIGVVLSNANLTGADLTSAKLMSSHLPKAEMEGVDLTNADLCQANLKGAYMNGAYLVNADLTGADLSGAILSGADLSNANLTDANLTSADLTGAILNDTILRGAMLSSCKGIPVSRQTKSS